METNDSEYINEYIRINEKMDIILKHKLVYYIFFLFLIFAFIGFIFLIKFIFFR